MARRIAAAISLRRTFSQCQCHQRVRARPGVPDPALDPVDSPWGVGWRNVAGGAVSTSVRLNLPAFETTSQHMRCWRPVSMRLRCPATASASGQSGGRAGHCLSTCAPPATELFHSNGSVPLASWARVAELAEPMGFARQRACGVRAGAPATIQIHSRDRDHLGRARVSLSLSPLVR